jgi:hypothetical protein
MAPRPLAGADVRSQSHGFDNVDNSYLVEDLRATGATTLYGRSEIVNKHVLGLGLEPKGFTHPHLSSHISHRPRRPPRALR